MKTATIKICKFEELNEEAQNKVINETIEFFQCLEKRPAFIKKALKKSEQMQTPWFFSSYCWEYGRKTILKEIKNNWYQLNGTFHS